MFNKVHKFYENVNLNIFFCYVLRRVSVSTQSYIVPLSSWTNGSGIRKWNQMSSCQTIISLLSGINRDVQFSRPPQPTDIYQLGDVVVGVVFVFVVVCFASVGFRFVRRCEHDLQATGGGRSP